jgi:hypothetical protein
MGIHLPHFTMKLAWLDISPFAGWVVMALLSMTGMQVAFESQVMMPLASSISQASRPSHTPAPATPATPASSPKARLDDIVLRLSNQPSLDDRILKMHQLATEYNVQLKKASYQAKETPENPIVQHEIQAELTGSYPAIRQFLHALLSQNQATALESVEVNRATGHVGVRVQVRFKFYEHP